MYMSSIIIDQVIDALAVLMGNFVEDPEMIVRGQENRVPLPLGNPVVLTELFIDDLEVPFARYADDDQTATIHGPKRIDIQVDFYGPMSADSCSAFKTAFRSQWGCSQLPQNIQPLYTSDGVQGPLVTGEQQYENRWTLTASLQYNPVIELPQQSATSLTVATVVNVDS